MCAVDDAEPWDFCSETERRAAKPHTCAECGRRVAVGERYHHLVGVMDGRWSTWRTCAHCIAAGAWMSTVCSGYLLGDLLTELVEHWDEGYRSIPFARLVVGVKRRWHGGRDPIPDADQVRALAREMMREAVAA